MQETLSISFNSHNEIQLAYRSIARGLRWIVLGVWKPIRWLLEAMFTPHPAEKYIEENRVKAIRLVGHF
jgi:hypothetical protein